MSKSPIPHFGPSFESMMREIDAKLTAEGKDIPSRPLLAAREVSVRHNISMPLAGNMANLPPDLKPYGPLSDAIQSWYQSTYGDKLKVDPCPGRTVVQLDGDLYTLAIPRIFGRAQFVISRQFLPKPGISRTPIPCNIVQLVDGMTPAKAAQLSDSALLELDQAFGRTLMASYILECTDHELMFIARGDVATAINCLMDRVERNGESKWASLQAAEKYLRLLSRLLVEISRKRMDWSGFALI